MTLTQNVFGVTQYFMYILNTSETKINWICTN